MNGLDESKFDVLRHKQIEGMRVYLNTLDYRTSHFHKEVEIILILDGDLDIQSETFHCVAQRGDVILCNSGEAHELKKVTKSCTLVGYHIAPSLISSEVPEFEQIRFNQFQLKDCLSEDAYVKMKNTLLEVALCYMKQPVYYKLFCVGQIKTLLYLFLESVPHKVLEEIEFRKKGFQNARLQRLIRFVEQNYMNKICLTDFACQEGMSMSYMSHFVKQTMHQSFQQYVNTVRFNAACRMIAADQMKMLDICMTSGFSDYKYFSNTFIKRTGMTPEVYHQNMIEARNAYQDDHERNKAFYTLHSIERFYTPDESIEVIERFYN